MVVIETSVTLLHIKHVLFPMLLDLHSKLQNKGYKDRLATKTTWLQRLPGYNDHLVTKTTWLQRSPVTKITSLQTSPHYKHHLITIITSLQTSPRYKDHLVTKTTGNKDHLVTKTTSLQRSPFVIVFTQILFFHMNEYNLQERSFCRPDIDYPICSNSIIPAVNWARN